MILKREVNKLKMVED